ncbi:MAG: flagellar hook-basal body protein [Firmicutes bacterium]|nr:flagellar hook-basal body protein [Bacillota bacterium]
MLRSIYNSRSGIAIYERSLARTAHNLANVNTIAYKRSEVLPGDTSYHSLQDRRFSHTSETRLPIGQGVHLQAATPFMGQGVLIETGRPLDLAISGEGYFRIISAVDGTTYYTRNGHFQLDGTGSVVTATGDYLDVPFKLTAETGLLSITPEGVVVNNLSGGKVEELGQIKLYRITNPIGLSGDGDGRYLESALSGEAEEGLPGAAGFGSIRQHYLEQSNTDTALEMVQLLLAQRALQANVRCLITADELQALILQVKT